MDKEELLKHYNLRVTKSRLEVIDFFSQQSSAISAQDIEAALPDADRVTMYRTLKTFEEKGIIHKAIDGTDIAKYALCGGKCGEHSHQDNHAHFHCSECQSTTCIEDITIPELKLPDHYATESINIIIKGICAQCTNT